MYAEPTTYDHAAGEILEHIGEVREDDLEVYVPRMPADPTLLTNYPTHCCTYIATSDNVFKIENLYLLITPTY